MLNNLLVTKVLLCSSGANFICKMLGMKQKIINQFPLVCLIIITLWLRLVNLGYSNYQGDEIKALYRPKPDQNLLDFLLHQRKGPIQFLITYIMSFFNSNYDNEFLLRLPFALAGIFAIYFFYKLVRLEFGHKIAFYSSFFVASNGLFVAFARIVQYQSFVILFLVLALYFLSLSTKYNHLRIYGLYLGMGFWGLSILAHYDGIFVAPFVFYLAYRWYINNRNQRQYLICAIICFIALVSVFYIPFFLSISESTKQYWSDRISRQSVSSLKTFTTYNPFLIIYLYLFLGLWGLVRIKENFSIFLWFLFPCLFLEIFVSNPGTHIYTYVLPFCILMAFGLEEIQSRLKNCINFSFLSAIYIICFYFSHLLFVDNQQEYPWEDKKVLFLTVRKQSRQSLFGFPYYRHWEKVGAYLQSTGSNGYFATNEKKSITRYYIPESFKNVESYPIPESLQGEIYVIYIKNPQSGNKKIGNKEESYWERKYKPLRTFCNHGRVVTTIYRISFSDWKNIVNQR